MIPSGSIVQDATIDQTVADCLAGRSPEPGPL